jgi:hypothetical protein
MTSGLPRNLPRGPALRILPRLVASTTFLLAHAPGHAPRCGGSEGSPLSCRGPTHEQPTRMAN